MTTLGTVVLSYPQQHPFFKCRIFTRLTFTIPTLFLYQCIFVVFCFNINPGFTSVPHKLSHVLIISPFQHHTLFTTYFFTSKIVHKFVSNIYSKNSIIHTFVQLCNYRYVVRIGVLYLRLWRFCELLTILGEIVIRYFFATF